MEKRELDGFRILKVEEASYREKRNYNEYTKGFFIFRFIPAVLFVFYLQISGVEELSVRVAWLLPVLLLFIAGMDSYVLSKKEVYGERLWLEPIEGVEDDFYFRKLIADGYCFVENIKSEKLHGCDIFIVEKLY